MKNLYAFLLLAMCVFGFKNYCYANCTNACNLNELQNLQNQQLILAENIINDYFDHKVSADMFFNKKLKPVYYSDLFIFNTIV